MYFKIRVIAGAKSELVRKEKEDTFTVLVKEKAEGGRANKRMQELIGAEFGVPGGAVRIVSGHHKPSKIVSIDGLELSPLKEV